MLSQVEGAKVCIAKEYDRWPKFRKFVGKVRTSFYFLPGQISLAAASEEFHTYHRPDRSPDKTALERHVERPL